MKRIVLRVGPWKGVWRIKGMGKEQILFMLKTAAVQFARARCKEYLAAGGNAQMVVHLKTGAIQYESTYGADPRRFKG